MNKKYFETKTGSIEEKITQIATEQPSIQKPEPNVKLKVERTYFDVKPGSISDVAAKIVSEGLDPVNKDAVKKKFDDRKDKDIDNDGDVDSTDKFLHKRRSAISKATSEAVMPDDKGEKINQMKHQKAKEGEKDIIKPISEDDMAKFHKMQKDGKSANDIAKVLGLDVKSVKKLMDLDEVNNPYAVGMAQAMKSKNDKPPLEKSTITKAHDIAKSIMKKEQVCPKCGKDHANKINASNCMGESKKTFSDLRTETKVIKLGDKGKTATGKEAGAVDVEPRAIPV